MGVPLGHGFHGNQGRQLQLTVPINILGIHKVIAYGADTGAGIFGQADIGQDTAAHGIHIRNQHRIFQSTGNKHGCFSAGKLSGNYPLKPADRGRELYLKRALHHALLHFIQSNKAGAFLRLTRIEDKQLSPVVPVQIYRQKIGIVDIQQLFSFAICKGVSRYGAQELIAQLDSHHQLHAAAVIHGHVLHLVKGCATELQGIREGKGLVLPLNHQNPQGPFSGRFCKYQKFRHPISVHIRSLNRLLVHPGKRCTVFHILKLGVQNPLQFLIGLGAPWQAVHLVHRFHGAAGKKQTRQYAKKYEPFAFHTETPSRYYNTILSKRKAILQQHSPAPAHSEAHSAAACPGCIGHPGTAWYLQSTQQPFLSPGTY